MRITSAVLILVLAVFVVEARATPISVANAGFEAVSLGDGASSSSVPSWSEIGATTLNPTVAQFPAEAPEGQNVAALTSATLSQTVGTLEFGTYTLMVNVGDPLDKGFGGYGINLRRGTTILVSSSSSLPTPADGTFGLATKTYDVLPTNVNGTYVGQTFNILLLVSTSSGNQSVFDDVQLQFTPLPEPSTLVLAGLGLALGLVARRRHSRSSRGHE